jgi:hypothetical protein
MEDRVTSIKDMRNETASCLEISPNPVSSRKTKQNKSLNLLVKPDEARNRNTKNLIEKSFSFEKFIEKFLFYLSNLFLSNCVVR